MHRSFRGPALLTALALVMAACGEAEPEATTTLATTTTSPPAATTTTEDDATPTTAAATATRDPYGDPGAAVETTEAPETGEFLSVVGSQLGEILADGAGNTVYMFVPDDQGESTCYGECADTWPPVPGDLAIAGEGADTALVGTTTRDDGSEQATYNGWPLYYFAPDTAAGDTQGQGVGDVWFVLGPDGEPING